MKVGNNTVQINVLAEDKITNKRYEIVVHRRNEQEELQYKQEQESGAERLSTILEEQNNSKNIDKLNKNNNIVWEISIIILGIFLIVGIIYIIKRQKMID